MSSQHIEKTMWTLIAAAAEKHLDDFRQILAEVEVKDLGSVVLGLAGLASRAALPDAVRYSPKAPELATAVARSRLLELAQASDE